MEENERVAVITDAGYKELDLYPDSVLHLTPLQLLQPAMPSEHDCVAIFWDYGKPSQSFVMSLHYIVSC